MLTGARSACFFISFRFSAFEAREGEAALFLFIFLSTSESGEGDLFIRFTTGDVRLGLGDAGLGEGGTFPPTVTAVDEATTGVTTAAAAITAEALPNLC